MPLASTRGDNGSTLPQPAEDEWIVFQLDAGVTEYDSYRAALERRDGSESEVIWSHAGLTPVRSEIAVGVVAGRTLRPGEYEIRLDGRMDDAPAERFEEVSRTRFTIVPRN